MGKHLNLDGLDDLFAKGKDFRLTEKLYKEITGAALPKTKSYLKTKSPLARKADKLGYVIADVQEEAIIERTVHFKKK